MKEIPFSFFDKSLIRIPILPVNALNFLDDIDHILSLKVFQEAIFIASPSLYHKAYIKKDRSEKTKLSLIKYFIRACTRCTPYGVFAGCNLVKSGDVSGVVVSNEQNHKTYLRIDMDCLCAIIRILEQDPNLRCALSYHINTSLYYVDDRVRYVEYEINDKKRKYTFSEIKQSYYIDLIIKTLHRNSLTIEELANIITRSDDDIKLSDAKIFINNLIDEQILISDLEPSIAGEDLIYQIQKKLLKIGCNSLHLNKIVDSLIKCNRLPIGNRLPYYQVINKQISELYKFNNKNQFHVDCKISLEKDSTIGNQIHGTILKGVYALNRFTQYKENETLKVFKQQFYSRFEEQEIPLSIVLDSQIGIGIGEWNELQGDFNPLIDDVTIPDFSSQNQTVSINNLQRLLISKYENCLLDGSYSINITENDLNKIGDVNYNHLPEQLSSIIKIINIGTKKTEPTISMSSIFGGSAANLISRFGYLDNSINQFVNKITNNESDLHSNKIVAEILHLPEDRIGNIQMHPINRKYGIPYLSNPNYLSGKLKKIHIDDIMVSVPNGNSVLLRSKKYNKEILPRLSTAHNYSRGLPIYYFLSMLQHQNNKVIYFDWGHFFVNKQFLPRVTFNNIILSPAKWCFYISDVPKQKDESFDTFYHRIVEWKNKIKLPDLIQIVEGDNKLLIDFNHKNLIKIFIKHLTTYKIIYLEEFLFSSDTNHLVKRGDEYFTNELIVCLYKKRTQ